MIYRNERTGAIIETAAVISGGGWQVVKPAIPVKAAPAKEEKPEKAGRRTGK